MPENKSCAVKTTCPYCGVGCGVIATVNEKGNVSIEGDKDHPANYGRLCSKGSALGETVDLNDRLLRPQVNQQAVSWEQALEEVAEKFTETIATYGKDSVAFYVSGQLLTEDYYVANKLMKGFIGSGNIDTNSRLCMSSAVAGHKRAFGNDTVGLCYEDLEQADVITLIGSNVAWCHPVLYQRIEAAKKKHNTKIVVVDPRQTHSCEGADLHLPIKPGTDATLFNGLLCYLADKELLDNDYIKRHTNDFDAAIDAARKTAGDIDVVAKCCDIGVGELIEFYELFAGTEKNISFFSMGINQSSSGVDKVNTIINVHLATGRIGKPGMGAFSITGQPNAMGGREVGGLASTLAAHMDFTASNIDRVGRFWETENVATGPGLKAVDLFRNIDEGKVKALWVMATNPAVSIPDATAVERAISKCDFVVVSDCINNTDTTRHADVLLPALGWGEKSGTVTNSERRISRQRKFLSPPVEAKPDWWIICQVARRLGFEQGFDFHSEADIFREHAALSGYENQGTRDFDISAYTNIDDHAYDNLVPTQWPVNDKNPEGTQRMLTNGHFYTADNKACFIAVTPRPPVEITSDSYPLVLNTGRVRDHWHTMTRTAKSKRLSRHVREPFAQLHPATAAAYNISHDQLVEITSQWGSVVVRADVTDRQRHGELFVPLHWNDQFSARARVDTVVNPHVDPISGQPEFKHTPVHITPVQHQWFGFMLSRKEYSLPMTYWTKLREENNWRYEFSDTRPYTIDWFKQRMRNGREYDWIEFVDEINNVTRYLWFDEHELQGCIFTADSYEALPARNWLSSQFSRFELAMSQRTQVLTASGDSNIEDQGEVICSCFNVGKNAILDCINQSCASSVDKIGAALKAGTNCGSCKPEIKHLISSSAKQRLPD